MGRCTPSYYSPCCQNHALTYSYHSVAVVRLYLSEKLSHVESVSHACCLSERGFGSIEGGYHIQLASSDIHATNVRYLYMHTHIRHSHIHIDQYSAKQKRYTVDNNVGGTNNLLAAIVDSDLDIHVVHLGTMGERKPNLHIECSCGYCPLRHACVRCKYLILVSLIRQHGCVKAG